MSDTAAAAEQRPGWRNPVRRVLAELPSSPSSRRLAVMALVDSTGTGAFLAVSAIFLTSAVGLSVAQVGVGLAVSAGIGLLTALPLGAIGDRYGPKRVLIAVSLWRAAWFVVYAFVPNFLSFLVVVCLLGLVDKATAPLTQALVSSAVAKADRVRTMAVMRSLRNIGFTLGALMGSVALGFDSRPAYAAILTANALSFAVFAVIAARLRTLTADVASVKRKLSFRVLRDRPYLAIASCNAVLTLHMTLLSIGLPLWVAQHSHAPKSVVAPLLAVNTVLAVLLQLRVTRGAETVGPAAATLRRGGFALAVCCLLLAFVPPLAAAPAIVLLVAATVALTMGELLQAAGGWTLSFELAKEDEQTAYLSVFWLGTSVQQIAAPLVVVAVVDQGAAGWIVLGLVLAAVGMLAPAVTRWAVGVRGAVAPAT